MPKRNLGWESTVKPIFEERWDSIASDLFVLRQDGEVLEIYHLFQKLLVTNWCCGSKELISGWMLELKVFSSIILFGNNSYIHYSIFCYDLGLRYYGFISWKTDIGTYIEFELWGHRCYSIESRVLRYISNGSVAEIFYSNLGVECHMMQGCEWVRDFNYDSNGWRLEQLVEKLDSNNCGELMFQRIFLVLHCCSFISSYQIQYSRMPNTYCYAYCEVMVTWDVEILKWPTGIGTCMGYHILHYIQDTEKGKKLEATIRNLLHYRLLVKMGAVKKLKQTILLLVHYGGLLANLYDMSAQHKKENQELIKQVYTALCQSKFKFGVAIVSVIWDLRHCLVVSLMTEIETLILYGVKDMEAMFSQCEQQIRTTRRVVKKYDPNAKPLPNQLKNSSFEWNGKTQVSYGDAVKNWTQFLANLPWNYSGIRSRAQNQFFYSLVGYMTNIKLRISLLHGLIKEELFLDYGTGSENLVIATLKFGAANVQTYKFPWDPDIWSKMIYKLILHDFIEILLQHQSWDPGIQYYDFTTLRTRLISTR